MNANKRKALRRNLRLDARVHVDKAAPMLPCNVIDISDTGARLAIESNENIPAEFSIVLSPNGGPSRNCKIVWRTEDHVGVAFDADGPCRDKKWTTSESF